VLCLGAQKGLDQSVGDHVGSGTIDKVDQLVLNDIVDKMIAYVNVFRAGMKLAYFGIGKRDGRLIVAVKGDRMLERVK
jgi:hypothetical protein